GVAGGVLAETLFLDLPLDTVARYRIDAVDEEDAVEVVDLVLQDARAEPRGAEGQRPSVRVLRLDLHPRRARDRREHARDRQTPFLARRLAAAIDDGRIQERLHAAAFLVGDDDQPERDAHLRRGQADADLVVHRLGHV